MNTHNSGTVSAVTVTASATLLKGHDIEPRIAAAISNVGAVTVYYGFNSSVTYTTGFPLAANVGKVSISGYHGEIYAVVESGTCSVRVLSY